jgi:HAD superfamily hydrolase (TIGR01509 family)
MVTSLGKGAVVLGVYARGVRCVLRYAEPVLDDIVGPVNLLWDFDGTLFDTYPAITGALLDTARELGVQADPADIEERAKVTLDGAVLHIAHLTGRSSRVVQGEFALRYSTVGPELQPPFADVDNVLRSVGARGGCNVVVTHRDGRSVAAFLGHFGFGSMFVGVVAGDEGLERKPSPAMYLEAMRRFHLTADVTAAIGDRSIDIEAADAAGIRSFWFRGSDDGPGTTFEDYASLLRELDEGTGAGQLPSRR